MPKRKPDQVIRHEFALAKPERDALDLFTTGYVVNRVGTPLVSIMSNPWAMLSMFTLFEALGVINVRKWIKDNTPLDEWYQMLEDGLFSTFGEAQKKLDEITDWGEQLKGDLTDLSTAPVQTVGGAVGGELFDYYNVPIEGIAGGIPWESVPVAKQTLSVIAWVKTMPSELGSSARSLGEKVTGTTQGVAEDGAAYVDAILRGLMK